MTAARLIHHATVWSEGHVLPGVDAVAITGGTIAAVGTARDLAAAFPQAERIDAAGATLTPGLADAHIHLLAWARALGEVALEHASGPEDAARRVAEFAAARPGRAIVGRGWDENRWGAPPRREVLDRVVPDQPVLLHSHDFHALWVNGEALRRARVGLHTPDPPGGRIERDARGEATGVLRENAVRLCTPLAGAPDESLDRESLRRAVAELHALGITSVHVFESSRSRRLLRELSADPRGIRVLMYLPHDSLAAALACGTKSGAGDTRFRIGGIKLFADGTLGSRTAATLAPYLGTDSTGMDLIAPAALSNIVASAAAGGLATAVHAIGDRALRAILDAFERSRDARRGLALSCRIEHIQLADPADMARLAPLGVVASLQPTHAISDIAIAERWWGDRLDRVYPWASLAARGATLAFGSDAPVEPPAPAVTLHAAVTRQRIDGAPAGGWNPRERLTLDQALTASTEGPARLAGNWPALGRITTGAEADLVLWDRDLHATRPESLHEAAPVMTMLAGRVVHAREGATLTRGAAA